MALKDLLVCIDPSPASETRLKLAFNLARANQAHLTGGLSVAEGACRARRPSPDLAAFPAMSGIVEVPVSPGGVESDVFPEAEFADRAEHRFKEELKLAGIDGEWRTLVDGGSAELIEFTKSVVPSASSRASERHQDWQGAFAFTHMRHN